MPATTMSDRETQKAAVRYDHERSDSRAVGSATDTGPAGFGLAAMTAVAVENPGQAGRRSAT